VERDFLDGFHFEQDVQLWFILPPNQTCNVHVHAGLTVGAIHGLEELADRHTWLEPKRTDDVDELDHTQAAFTAFIFGDERLRLGEAFCDLRLGQVAALAEVTQETTQHLLARRAQGVAHG